jgi:hypothetical protein
MSEKATIARTAKAQHAKDAKAVGSGPRPSSQLSSLSLQQTLGNQAMLQLLEAGAIHAKLRVSQPGDPDEIEADRAAEKVVARSRAPVSQRKCACDGGSPCSKCAAQEEEESIHRSVATSPLRSPRLTIQRAPADPTSTSDPVPAAPETQPPGAKTSGALVVEDNATKVEPYQMRKSQFITLLRTDACAAADRALTSVKHTTKGCPYVAKWLSFYEKQSSEHIERAIHKYAPEAATARSAHEAIRVIVTRVERAAIIWAKTGKVEGIPKELASEIPGQGGFLGAVQSVASSKVGGAILGFIGGTKKQEDSDHDQIQRKAQNATATPAHDAAGVKKQLGGGHSLNSRVQSQMSSAFGHDFSGVRVHTDSSAAKLSSDLQARAFTVGNDVAFASGEYRPGTLIGDALIAHELAHVVQQKSSHDASFADRTEVSSSALEKDANQAAMGATRAVRSGPTAKLAGFRPRSVPRLHSGLRLQRCGSEIDPSLLPAPPDYDAVMADLRSLYQRKQQITRGQASVQDLTSIDAQIEQDIAQLRLLGISLDDDKILELANTGKDLRQIAGEILRSPEGPVHFGQRLQFILSTDYLPPERNVRVEWRWKAKKNEYQFLRMPKGFAMELDEAFWTLATPQEIEEAKGMEVLARVYLGDDKDPSPVIDRKLKTETPTQVFSSGWIPFSPGVPSDLEILPSQKVAVPKSNVIFKIKDWAPPSNSHFSIDWQVDGTPVAEDFFVLTHAFTNTGKKKITAKIYNVERYFGIRKKELLQPGGEIHVEIEVLDPVTMGTNILQGTQKVRSSPALSSLETSIKQSMKEFAAHAALGGERKAYWEERYQAQEKQLAGINAKVPYFKETKELPSDLSSLDPTSSYSAPIPALIVYPTHQGNQPLNIYLALHQESGNWAAKLIDITGAKVLEFLGSGVTALDAITGAFSSWRTDNPYPTGGTLVYSFNPAKWSLKNNFDTTTAWKTAKEWVDSIIQIGGVVLAGLLISAPEASLTKILGFAILSLSVARSGVAIYENLKLGSDTLDIENVIEGLSIITAALGLGGGVLREMGTVARNVRPAMFRVGNVLIMTSLAGDVGTLVYATDQAALQLRAVQGDPTLDDAQRQAELMRVMSSLFLSAALVIVSNKQMFKGGFAKGDFIKERIGTGDVKISQGARLDLEVELRETGMDPASIRSLSDHQLVETHFRLQHRQRATATLSKTQGQLSGVSRAEFHKMEAEFSTPEDFAAAIEDQADPKAFFEKRAADRQSAAAEEKTKSAEEKKQAATTPVPTTPVVPPSKFTESIARLQKFDPQSKIEIVSPTIGGAEAGTRVAPENQLRINGQIDIGPDKLVEMPDDHVKKLLTATRALDRVGGDPSKFGAEDRKTLEQFAASGDSKDGKHRFRFAYQRKEVDTILNALGLSDKPLFENLSDAEKNRLYDVLTDRTLSGAPNLPRQAADYALSRNPASAREFANHFEFYKEQFEQRTKSRADEFKDRVNSEISEWEKQHGPTDQKQRSRIQDKVRKDLGIKGKEKEFFAAEQEKTMSAAAATPGVTSAEARKNVGDVYDALVREIGGRVGSGTIEPNLSPDQTVDRIKALHEVTFASESAAAYHGEKHFGELVDVERNKSRSHYDAYMASAQETIKNPTNISSSTTQEGSARSYVFKRNASASDGTVREMTAIVIVTSDGRVILATYGGSRVRS